MQPGSRSRLLLTALAVGAVLAPVSRASAEPNPVYDDVVQLTALGGVQFAGKINADQGRLEVGAGPALTVQGAFRVQTDGYAIVSYSRQFTDATAFFSDGSPSRRFDLDIGLLQAGGELDLPVRQRLIGFIGLTVGAMHLTPQGVGGGTQWFFSGTAFGGVKVPITRNVGLRAQGRFIGTLISANTRFACAVGGGAACVLSVSDAEALLQGDVVAGLYVAF